MKIFDILVINKEKKITAVADNNTDITYKELFLYCKARFQLVKNLFENKFVGGIYIDNSVEYVKAYFLIAMVGKCIVPIYYNANDEEIKNTLVECKISVLYTCEKDLKRIRKICKEIGMQIIVIAIDTEHKFLENGTRFEIKKVERRMLKDVAILLYTSGSTNKPKRVMLSNSNVISNVKACAEYYFMKGNEKCLIVLPLCFGYCNTSQFLTHMYMGASIFIYQGVFSARNFMRIVDKKKITNTTLVPTMMSLIEDRIAHIDVSQFDSLKTIYFGGAPVNARLLNSLKLYMKEVDFIQTYGQTEASPRITVMDRCNRKDKINSVGRPLSGIRIKIVDERGRGVKKGNKGEIVVKGKNIMKGYYNDRNATRRIIKRGWLHTGDIGYLDAEGFLYLVGRIKNIIISAGINISPEEIEKNIMMCPGVSEVLVKGEPDELRGEMVCAYIVTERKEDSELERIKIHCQKTFPKYKMPQKIVLVDEIEKTYNGKKVRR